MAVSEQLEKFIAENGGNTRDALSVALARLAFAERKLAIVATIEPITEQLERAKVLIKATIDILTECENSPIVLDVMEQTAVWDGVECDGACLKDELEQLLAELESTNLQTTNQ